MHETDFLKGDYVVFMDAMSRLGGELQKNDARIIKPLK